MAIEQKTKQTNKKKNPWKWYLLMTQGKTQVQQNILQNKPFPLAVGMLLKSHSRKASLYAAVVQIDTSITGMRRVYGIYGWNSK